MNRLDPRKRAQVVAALVEGNSIRATVRMTGVAKNTIQKLLLDLGVACLDFQDRTIRGLQSKRIQIDEIWSFVGAKKKTIQKDPSIMERNPDAGDLWTWVAIDADSKLIVSWLAGSRDAASAYQILSDIRTRVANRIQLTSDQLSVYLKSVDRAFGVDVDYAMLHKIYSGGGDGRYSPAECIGTKKVIVTGDPDPTHISTSFIERQNLTMRMQMRRYTRLTNAFSKKAEHHVAALSLHYAHYNFCRVHQSLRVTPAMEAGLADHVWSIDELVRLLLQ